MADKGFVNIDQLAESLSRRVLPRSASADNASNPPLNYLGSIPISSGDNPSQRTGSATDRHGASTPTAVGQQAHVSPRSSPVAGPSHERRGRSHLHSSSRASPVAGPSHERRGRSRHRRSDRRSQSKGHHSRSRKRRFAGDTSSSDSSDVVSSSSSDSSTDSSDSTDSESTDSSRSRSPKRRKRGKRLSHRHHSRSSKSLKRKAWKKIVRPHTSFPSNKAQVKFNVGVAKDVRKALDKCHRGKVRKDLKACLNKINNRNEVVYVADSYGHKIAKRYQGGDAVLSKSKARKIDRLIQEERSHALTRGGSSGGIQQVPSGSYAQQRPFQSAGVSGPRFLNNRYGNPSYPSRPTAPPSGQPRFGASLPQNMCSYCFQRGHWKKDCQKLAKKRVQGGRTPPPSP